LISEKRKFDQIFIKTNDKFDLFCCQYMYDMINSKLTNFQEKKFKKLIKKSSDFSSLYRNIKYQTKYSLNPIIYKFNNESIQS
jgi:hypothetical protein